MEVTQPFQKTPERSGQDSNSQFLIVDRDDIQQIESLSKMFPRLISMIKNNTDKNLVLNFRDERQRSLIVMIVSKSAEGIAQVPMAS